MKPALATPDYTAFLAEMKGRIESARLQAGRAVNRELILLYWDIGRGIVEKQQVAGWGDAVVERLAADLQAEFPDMQGFSARSTWEMKRLYIAFTRPDFLQQLVAELKKERKADHLDLLQQADAELETLECKNPARVAPEFPSSFPLSVLERPVPEILARAVRELVASVPWGHHVLIQSKIRPQKNGGRSQETVSSLNP